MKVKSTQGGSGQCIYSIPIQAQERTYSNDTYEEAIVDFVKDHEEFYNKTNEHFRTRPGRIGCGRSLEGAAMCQ